MSIGTVDMAEAEIKMGSLGLCPVNRMDYLRAETDDKIVMPYIRERLCSIHQLT